MTDTLGNLKVADIVKNLRDRCDDLEDEVTLLYTQRKYDQANAVASTIGTLTGLASALEYADGKVSS